MKYCALYNPGSGGKGQGKNPAQRLTEILKDDEVYYRSMPEVKDFRAFFTEVNDDIIICGGDGTLSYFLNKVKDIHYKNHLLYFPTGSGNDFCADLGADGSRPFNIDALVEKLPVLRVKNEKYVVFNGAGAGIDGYVCAEGERLRRAGGKVINYTMAGVKGLLYDFQPRNILLSVDGVEYTFNNVWFSPIMLGKYFGGGMMVAPMRDRKRKDLSVVVATCKSRLKVMALFPKIFKGEHVKNRSVVKIFHGQKIKVKLDRPAPLQYDGEVILGVSEYEMEI